ncbi:MAG: MarR family winged helix-turn-helix transcriptional regulator [Microthrixaceae bacterium]
MTASGSMRATSAGSAPSSPPEPRWLDEREARAWRNLQMMNGLIETALARRLGLRHGLSYPDYRVLVPLSMVEDGRMRVFELCEVTGWEKSRMSHHLHRMGLRGLVETVRCDTDRRGAWIGITADGRRAIEAAAPSHVADVRELFVDLLTGEQLDAIADAAEVVLLNLGASPLPGPRAGDRR